MNRPAFNGTLANVDLAHESSDRLIAVTRGAATGRQELRSRRYGPA